MGKSKQNVYKMYHIDCELDSQDEDCLLKMGIDKNDYINELDELITCGGVN